MVILNNTLTVLQPKLLTNNQNFEMLFSVVNTDETTVVAEGNFRSKADYAGMYWETNDLKSHALFKRPIRTDFSGIVLEYSYNIEGHLPPLDATNGQTLTVTQVDGTIHYVRMWNYVYERPITTEEQGPNILFPHGRTPGTDTGTQGKIRIDFDNLYSGWSEYLHVVDDVWASPNDEEAWTSRGLVPLREKWLKIDPTQIALLQWGFTPIEYQSVEIPPPGEEAPPMDDTPLDASSWFKFTMSNWTVTGNTYLGEIPSLDAHSYRIADDYDDSYDITPQWALEQLYRLGFREWLNFYVGASHYYDKKGKVVDGQFVRGAAGKYIYEIITERPFNDGFKSWYINYLYWCEQYGYNKFVHSISMESVDAPESWWQYAADGSPGTTMWVPTPHLLSFTSDGLLDFYYLYTEGLCELSEGLNLKIYIQLGEPWWWWIEAGANKAPCFYDESTKAKHLAEMGYPLPVWYSSEVDNLTAQEKASLQWLRQKIGEFTHNLRDNLRVKYPEVGFTTLYFPPSVRDPDRVPPMMGVVNRPAEYWMYPSLDIFQIEDYDFVIAGEWDKNDYVYKESLIDFQYPRELVQYFAGFVLGYQMAVVDGLWTEIVPMFPVDISEQDYYDLVWSRVNLAAMKGVDQGLVTFIWARTIIMQHDWIPPVMQHHTENVIDDPRFDIW